MSELFLLLVAIAAGGTGLWLHDVVCIAAGIVVAFAAWLLRDVDSCIERSQSEPDEFEDSEWLCQDLKARTLR